MQLIASFNQCLFFLFFFFCARCFARQKIGDIALFTSPDNRHFQMLMYTLNSLPNKRSNWPVFYFTDICLTWIYIARAFILTILVGPLMFSTILSTQVNDLFYPGCYHSVTSVSLLYFSVVRLKFLTYSV